MKIKVRPTFYWRLMVLWISIFRGPKDNVQGGTIFYGGAMHLIMFLENPGERVVLAQTSMSLQQAKHFHQEMGRQIERMEAFS